MVSLYDPVLNSCVLHCGGGCESTLPKPVQRHCSKSSGMCLGEPFHLQHHGP